MRYFLTSLLFTLLLIPIAFASGLTETQKTDIAALENGMNGLLEYQKATQAFSSTSITYHGDVSVVPQDDHYLITMPKFVVRGMKTNNADSLFMAYDPILIKAKRDQSTPHLWQMVIEMPHIFKLQEEQDNGENVDHVNVTFDAIQSLGLFNEKLGYFTKLNTQLDGMTVKKPEDTGITLGHIHLYMNLEEDENALHSGKMFLKFKDFSATPANKEDSFHVGEFRVGGTIDAVALPTLLEYQALISKHAETFAQLNTSESTPQQVGITPQDIFDMISDVYSFDMNGFSIAYTLDDLALKMGAQEVALNSGRFTLSSDGYQDETGDASARLSYHGLKVDSVDTPHADLAPNTLDIGFALRNVPYQTLTKMGSQIAQTLASDPQKGQMAAMSMVMRLPAILANAGTVIEVKDNVIENDVHNYKALLNGQVETNMSSLIGVVAHFKGQFDGLDELITTLKTTSTTTHNNAIIKQLEMLQRMGQASNAAETSRYSYDFTLDEGGQFMLNGAPFKRDEYVNP